MRKPTKYYRDQAGTHPVFQKLDGKLEIRSEQNIAYAAHDTYSSLYEVLRFVANTSDFIVSLQDGTGRVQMLWNATPGVSPVFLVAAEDAFKLLITIGGVFTLYYASGSGKVAGDSITWTELLSVTSTTITYLGNTVWHAANDGAGSGLDADLLDGLHASDKVSTTRQIIAGVGLSGGGDLTADRTLTVAIPTLYIEDQKASGTHGGPSVAGVWTQRDLNTVVTNSISGASLSSNRITLPAGTYFVEASAPVHMGNNHKVKLYNYTDSADILTGTSEQSAVGDNCTTRSFLKGVFTLDAVHEIELRHRVAATVATYGFGVASNMGVIEVYSQIEIRKIA